jgi:type II secretory ATPase GspE/PulE/Tfp pilus assembly ATPase PilB-like protein
VTGNGVVVFSGPPCSGKSTTVQDLLDATSSTRDIETRLDGSPPSMDPRS